MPRTPFPLGRALQHDEASRLFPAPADTPIESRRWPHVGKVLDQGQVGSCTGNAAAQSLNHRPNHLNGSLVMNEADALRIYGLATQLDGFPGTYPEEDTGSSGLAAAKACQQLGYISGYTHAFGLDHLLAALMVGPLIVGTDWHEDMFNPDPLGIVKPTGAVVGGHEYVVDGVHVAPRMIRFLNSWSNGWGHRGHFWMTFDDFATLLGNDGDAIQFTVAP